MAGAVPATGAGSYGADMYSLVDGPVGPAEMVAPAYAVPPAGFGRLAARAGGS
jgi:hypothetical protein